MRLVTLLFLSLCTAFSALSADMTAREVTAYLFRSAAGIKPDLSYKDLSGLDLSDLDFIGWPEGLHVSEDIQAQDAGAATSRSPKPAWPMPTSTEPSTA